MNLERAYKSQGQEIINQLEKGITLVMIDQSWKEHLRAMDDLRQNVQFASHEQKDPLLIYKFESYELFKNMVAKINSEIAAFLMRAQLPRGEQQPVRQAQVPRAADQGRLQMSKAEALNMAERSSVSRSPQQRAVPAGPPPRQEPVKAEVKVGRNDPCPCGSGKKYKNCHGAS